MLSCVLKFQHDHFRVVERTQIIILNFTILNFSDPIRFEI